MPSPKRPARITSQISVACCDALEKRMLMSVAPGGTLLVADTDSLGGKGAIFSIATDGTKTVLASKAPMVDPKGIVEDIAGNIYIADSNAGFKRRGAIFKIDSLSGSISMLSQDGSGLGELLLDPTGLAFGPDGNLYVADPNAGFRRTGAVIKIDIHSGVQTIVSQNGPDFGTNLVDPTGIAFDHNGNIIIADPNAGGGNGEVIEVDPDSGLQNVISKDGNGRGTHLHNPMGVAIQSNGVILIVDMTTGTKNRGALVQIDPVSGVQTEISLGGKFRHPAGVAIGPDGSIYVTQPQGFGDRGGIIKVSSRGSQGKTFSGIPLLHPFGIAVARNLAVNSSKIANQSGIAGTSFSLNLSHSFTEADGTHNLTYSAIQGDGTPLPGFLSIDASGVLSGIPTAAGHYTIIATATDPARQSASATFALDVTGPQLANIQLPPPLVITENGSGVFSFTASTSDKISQISQVALTGFPNGWTVDLASLNSNPAVVSSSFADGVLTVAVHPTFSLPLSVTMIPGVHQSAPFTLSVGVNTIRDTGTATVTVLTTVIVDAVAAMPAVAVSIGAGANFVVPVTVTANFNYPLDFTEADTVLVTLPTGFGLVAEPAGGVFNSTNQTITFAQPIGAQSLNASFSVILPTNVIPASLVSATASVIKMNTSSLDTNVSDKTATATTSSNIVDNEAATLINSVIGHDDPAITSVTTALDAAKLKLAALGATSPLSASLIAFIQLIDNVLADPALSTAQQVPTISGMIGGGASSVIARLGTIAAKIDGNSSLGSFSNVVIQPPVLGGIQVVNLGSGIGGLVFNQLTYPGRPIGFQDQADGSYTGPATVSGNTIVFAIHGVNFVSSALTSPIPAGGGVVFNASNGDVLTVLNDGNAIANIFATALAAKINRSVTSATYIQLTPGSVSYNGNTVVSFGAAPGGQVGNDASITDTAGEVFASSGVGYPVAPGTPVTFNSTTRPGVAITVTTGTLPVSNSAVMQSYVSLLFGFAGAQLAPALDTRIAAVMESVGGTTTGNLQQQIDQLAAQLQASTNPGNIFASGAFASVNQATSVSGRLAAFLSLFSTGNYVNPISNTISLTLGATAPTTLDALLQEMTDANAITAAPSSLVAGPTAALSDITTIVDTSIGHDDPLIADLTGALAAAKGKLIALGSSDVLTSSLLAFIQSIDNALAGAGLSTAQQIPTLINMLTSVSSATVMQPLQADGALLDGSNQLNADVGVVVMPSSLGLIQVVNVGSDLGGIAFSQLTYPGRPIGFEDDSSGSHPFPASLGGNGDIVNVLMNGETFSSPVLTATIPAGGTVAFTAPNGDSFTVTNDSNPITASFAVGIAGKINLSVTTNTYIQVPDSAIAYDGGRTISFGANPASADISGTVTLVSSTAAFSVSGLSFPIAPQATIILTSTSNPGVHLTVQNGTVSISDAVDLANRLNVLFPSGSQVAPSLDSKINDSLNELSGNTSGNLQADVASLATQLQALSNPHNIFDPTAFAAINQATSLAGKMNAFLALFNTTNCPQGTITITLGVTPPATLQGLLDLMH